MSETQGIMPHAPAHPLAAGVADAMIAQTVGEQIDQMLAKAEVERSSSASDAAAQPTGDASGVKSDVVGDLNRLIDNENEAASDAPPSGHVAEPPPQRSPGIPGEGQSAALPAAPAPTAEAAPDAISEVQAADEGDESPESHEAPLPAWLKPLELLNQPFLFIPDSVRSALGKAAIVTLVNATALFIYVLKFRNNHH